MGFDSSGFEQMLGTIEDLQKNYEVFIRSFLTEIGQRAMAKTKAITPVNTGNLRGRWELSQVLRRGDELYIVLFNPAEYASFVEDGHMQHHRWVPGIWKGNKFEYIKGAKTGMMLTEKWIPGFHMARISITKVEQELPRRYERAFKEFLTGLGAM